MSGSLSSSSSSNVSANGSSSSSNGTHSTAVSPAVSSLNGSAASTSAASPAERDTAGTAGAAATAAAGRGGEGLRVELRDVEFGYSGGRQVLRGVSIVAEPGESIAVVGECARVLCWAHPGSACVLCLPQLLRYITKL